MNRKHLIWLLLIVIVLIGGLFLFLNTILGTSDSPPSSPTSDTVSNSLTMTAISTSDNSSEPVTIPGPLFPNPDNPRYFTDGILENGKYRVVYLTGSHTWCNFTDCGNTNPPPVFDYIEFLDFLEGYDHNFFRLWRAENVRGGEGGDDFWFYPIPYERSQTECCAFDGGNKFDLTKFDQTYFDRLRERVIQAGERNIYVSIMLFDGWSVENKFPATHQPWRGHPFNANNNINNVDGDSDGNGQGGETHTLENPEITALQEAYVRKVIDTVKDLDNVLYEISNESSGDSKLWQYHMIEYIKEYESHNPKQHPVGMTVAWPNGSNEDLRNSPADWISQNGDMDNPPLSDGLKVILSDTDHLCGICGNQQWVWKSFTRGENPIFMDFYNNAISGRGIPFENEFQEEIRVNLGYTRIFANRMNMVVLSPLPDLCSTTYCLVNPVAKGAEYLVFLPSGGTVANILHRLGIERDVSFNLRSDSTVDVDLSASPVELTVEWFNPVDGSTTYGGKVQGGDAQSFTAPFSGDAILYIYDAQRP